MNEKLPQIPSVQNLPVSLWQLSLLYLLIGTTGVGPAFLTETKKHLVQDRRWISEEDFINGLALAQLLPGATYVSVTVYIGYKLRGIAGALTSFFAFLLPSFCIMTLLSYIYFVFGALPQIDTLFKGMEVVVAGLLSHAVLEIGKSAVTGWRGKCIAMGAIGVMVYFSNIFMLLFMSILAGILLHYRPLKRQEEMTFESESRLQCDIEPVNIPIKHLLMLVSGLVAIFFVASFEPILLQLGTVFFRMGAFLFGGGPSMIPFIQQEVVNHYHWLTLDEFVVGIALGQITPGPLLITATFIGYKVAAVRGAIAATLGIFLPSLLLVMATAEIHQRIKHNLWVRAAIKGVAAAFAGMMLVVSLGIIKHSVGDIPSAILALTVFTVLHFSKLNTIWIVIGGTAVYWLGHNLILQLISLFH